MSLPVDELSKAMQAYFSRRGQARTTQAELSKETNVSEATIMRIRRRMVHVVELETWMKLHRYAPDEFPSPTIVLNSK